MTVIHKIGFCPCCDEQIMVRDVDGRWSSRKTNYANINLIFDNGQKLSTIICKNCIKNMDYQCLMDSILNKDSTSLSETFKNMFKDRLPVSYEMRK